MASVTISVPLLSPGSAARRTGPRPESWTIPPVDINETFIRKLAILILSLVDPFDAFYIRWTADHIRTILCSDNEIVPWLTWINRASYQSALPLPRVPKNLDRLIFTMLPAARITATTSTFNSSWKIAETMTLIGLPTPKEKVLALQHCLRNALDYKKLPRCRDPLPRSILGVSGLHRRMTTLEQQIGQPPLDTRFTVVLALSQDYAWPETVKTLAVTGELDHLQMAALQQLHSVRTPVLAVALVVVVLLTPPFETKLEVPHPGFPFEAEMRDNFFLGLNALQAKYGLQHFAQSLTPAMANLPEIQLSDMGQWNQYWDATLSHLCAPPGGMQEDSDRHKTFSPIPPALYVPQPIQDQAATHSKMTQVVKGTKEDEPDEEWPFRYIDSGAHVRRRVGLSDRRFNTITTLARQVHFNYIADNPHSPYADPHVTWGTLDLAELRVLITHLNRLCHEQKILPPKMSVLLRSACLDHRIHAVRKTWMYALRAKLKRAENKTSPTDKSGPPPHPLPPPMGLASLAVQRPTVQPTAQADMNMSAGRMDLGFLLCP